MAFKRYEDKTTINPMSAREASYYGQSDYYKALADFSQGIAQKVGQKAKSMAKQRATMQAEEDVSKGQFHPQPSDSAVHEQYNKVAEQVQQQYISMDAHHKAIETLNETDDIDDANDKKKYFNHVYGKYAEETLNNVPKVNKAQVAADLKQQFFHAQVKLDGEASRQNRRLAEVRYQDLSSSNNNQLLQLAGDNNFEAAEAKLHQQKEITDNALRAGYITPHQYQAQMKHSSNLLRDTVVEKKFRQEMEKGKGTEFLRTLSDEGLSGLNKRYFKEAGIDNKLHDYTYNERARMVRHLQGVAQNHLSSTGTSQHTLHEKEKIYQKSLLNGGPRDARTEENLADATGVPLDDVENRAKQSQDIFSNASYITQSLPYGEQQKYLDELKPSPGDDDYIERLQQYNQIKDKTKQLNKKIDKDPVRFLKKSGVIDRLDKQIKSNEAVSSDNPLQNSAVKFTDEDPRLRKDQSLLYLQKQRGQSDIKLLENGQVQNAISNASREGIADKYKLMTHLLDSHVYRDDSGEIVKNFAPFVLDQLKQADTDGDLIVPGFDILYQSGINSETPMGHNLLASLQVNNDKWNKIYDGKIFNKRFNNGFSKIDNDYDWEEENLFDKYSVNISGGGDVSSGAVSHIGDMLSHAVSASDRSVFGFFDNGNIGRLKMYLQTLNTASSLEDPGAMNARNSMKQFLKKRVQYNIAKHHGDIDVDDVDDGVISDAASPITNQYHYLKTANSIVRLKKDVSPIAIKDAIKDKVSKLSNLDYHVPKTFSKPSISDKKGLERAYFDTKVATGHFVNYPKDEDKLVLVSSDGNMVRQKDGNPISINTKDVTDGIPENFGTLSYYAGKAGKSAEDFAADIMTDAKGSAQNIVDIIAPKIVEDLPGFDYGRGRREQQ